MTKKIVSLLFAVLFLGLCAVPAVGLVLTGGAKAGANEVLAPKPALTNRDGSLNGDYLADLADYVGDRFYLRQECVTAWARLNAALFHTSVTEDVILGADGWLYYAPTLPDYTRSEPMSGRELWCAARTLWLLQEYAESRGGQFLFTIAPNKNSLYAAAMPACPMANRLSNVEALRILLGQMGINYVNLFDVFETADEVLYFPTDSHWNGKGAALAADAILSALRREDRYHAGPFTDSEHRGDLYEMLYPAGKALDPDYAYAPGFTFTANTANPDNLRITAEGPGEGTLLMYRDSFGRNLYPYLAESFAHAEFSRKTNYDPTAMVEGGTLVIELVERNLRYLNTYVPVLPAPTRETGLIAGAVERGELSLTASAGPEGYTTLTGIFAGIAPDADSPVYLSVNNGVYEAAPQPEGFSALLPESAARGEVGIVFTADGNLVSLRGVIE